MVIRYFVVGLWVVLVGDLGLGEEASQKSLQPFRYIVDCDDAPKPFFRTIEQGLPDAIDQQTLLGKVDPDQSHKWAFSWFSYGQNSSRSVAIAVRDGNELFVDLDRDRIFSSTEQIDTELIKSGGDATQWRFALDAEFITLFNKYDPIERSLIVRLGKKPETLEIATEGVMKGTVSVAGEELIAIRIDRDSNGRWFDSRDRILLDTNRDQRLDAIGERIACDSVCSIANRRYVLQSDLAGEQLQLNELSGTGQVVARLDLPSSTASIRTISAVIVSQGGIRVPIRELDRKIECPVGKYHIEELTMELSDQETSYWFRFNARFFEVPTINISKGETTEASLLGRVSLTTVQTTAVDGNDRVLTVHPRLLTSNGLFLTGGRHGRGSPTLENRLIVESSIDGRTIDTNSTGFS